MGEFYEVEIRSNLDSRSGSGLFFKGLIRIRIRKKTIRILSNQGRNFGYKNVLIKVIAVFLFISN